MSVISRDGTDRPLATRSRMLAVAMALFSERGFAGTSLQMIADELDMTKAAIYYHFRTRDELLLALMRPILAEIGKVVTAAESRRSARARAEAMVEGYAGVVARNRLLAAVTVSDPSVRSVLRSQPEWAAIIDRELALLRGSHSGISGATNAAVIMTGLAGAAATAAPELADDILCAELVTVGRRILGLAKPNGD